MNEVDELMLDPEISEIVEEIDFICWFLGVWDGD